MNDGKGSFRCLLRNLRKMHEAKTANPRTVPRDIADQLADACQTEHLLALLQHIGGGECQCDPEVGMAPCEMCVASLAATRITAALAAYRQSGPPCHGCVGTEPKGDWVCCCGAELDGSHDHNSCGPPEPRSEPASSQSWRCPTHMLAESLARVTALEEALQAIVNTHDADTLASEIARKALAAKP